ncbi:MAG: response regulator transcription factor [Alicyclobacillaceae bacterium]|nr:response regulator transcription factor [Alicyclobacillaceae bacterium]
MRILLMDDEVALVKALAQVLKEHRYEVDAVYDGHSGLEMARTGAYELLIVDVMMPRLSGLEVVRTLRAEGDATSILLLTAKDSVESRVEGLDSGADDYLVKPFAMPELLARVRALTRRPGQLLGPQEVRIGALSLNLTTRVVSVQGHAVSLSAKEFQVLELLMRNAGRVLPKVMILERVWGYDAPADVNMVEIYVHMLRKKLSAHCEKFAPAGSAVPVIETVRGIGYRLKVG